MSKLASDYNRLRDLLAAQQWKEADDETARIMLKIAVREAEGWLDCESIAKIPCDDLNTIDQLWMQHSNNRFGISIWKDIWSRFGCKVDNDTEHRIGEAVGWYEGGWKFGELLDFSLGAPVGHLPNLSLAKQGILLRWIGCSEVMHSALAWRFANCSLTDHMQESTPDIVQPEIDVKYEQRGTTLFVNVTPQETQALMNSLSVDYNRALFLLDHGEFSAGLDAFETILQAHPNFAEAYRCKGVALTFLGRCESALSAFKAALQLEPTFELAYAYQEIALDKLGRSEEVLQSYETLLKFNPQSVRGHCRRGVALYKLERYEEALNSIEQALHFDSTNDEIYRMKASLLETMQRSEEALAAFDEAIRLSPSNYLNYYFKGTLLERLGRWNESLMSLDEALRLNSYDPSVPQTRKAVLEKIEEQH